VLDPSCDLLIKFIEAAPERGVGGKALAIRIRVRGGECGYRFGCRTTGFARILRKSPFREKHCYHTALVSPLRRKWDRWHMRYSAAPFRFLTHVPVLNEVFTDRIVAELTK